MTSARFLVFTSVLVGLAAAPAAEPETTTPEIIFSGVITAGGKTHVALTDPTSKSTSWVQIGNEFGDYSVERYDPKDDAVFLRKGSREIRVALALAKTTEPDRAVVSTAPSAALDAAGIAIRVRTNLRQLATAAQQYRQGNNVKTVSFNDLVGPGKLIPQLNPVAGENYTTLNFGPDVTAVSVTTVDGATIALELRPPTPPVGTIAGDATTPADATASTPGQVPGGAVAGTPAPPAAQTPATTGGQPAAVAGRPAPTPAPTNSPAASPRPATQGTDPSPTLTGRQPPSPSYTILGGDTLQSIAAANGVTVQQVQEMNPTLHGSSLQAGETIRIR